MENKSSFDKTQIFGLVLIGLIFIYFSYTSTTAKPEEEATPQNTEEVAPESTPSPASEPETTAVVDTSVLELDSTQEAVREPEMYTLENEVLSLTISDEGAQIVKARLKGYQTYDSLPLMLFEKNQAMNFSLGGWNSTEAWYTPIERTATSLALQAEGPNGPFVLRWALRGPDEYQMDFTVSGTASGAEVIHLDWLQDALQHEKSITLENQKTTVYFYDVEDGDYDYLSESGSDTDEGTNLRWIANKQQYFTSILTADSRFDRAEMSVQIIDQPGYTKRMQSSIDIGQVNGEFNLPMSLYLGPNKYDILKTYDQEYDKLIDFGWGIFGWISRGVVVKVFNWLDGYGLNYGVIILIMALMIKLVLSPLTFSSYRSMAKMRVLKPEIDEINEEYKDEDAMKKQQAMMELYRKAGVNPLGGCIPQLLQFPILIAMFRFFPASIELRQQSFLWATDLSSYDSIAQLPFEIPFYGDHISLFTILMAISTFMYSYMNQQMTGTNSQMPQMKIIIYLMPVMLLFFFNSYPAGLSYYYLVANLITFGQQFAIRAFIDDKAIHAKLQANKEKPKKQSKFSQRLNKAMEQQQDNQQQMNRRMRRMNKD